MVSKVWFWHFAIASLTPQSFYFQKVIVVELYHNIDKKFSKRFIYLL